ncbi:MAG: UvrD-helicase domain-containing protein [Flavobacteriaceae bacterium]|jgi:ATP-dependent exoDNAse (exonuclease V) beta subunit|nr:UvrD-helicase domain-containing protein [Flavobacteriaceae bacterium]
MMQEKLQFESPSFSIYNASAGSGKTHTLVKEYLKILLLAKKEDAYKNILAITFTNKAVAEMKTRVVSCLHAFSLDVVPEKYSSMLQQVLGETGLNEGEVREKAKRIIKSIIHNYAAFDISTIDKFTHKVIRSFAFDLDLPLSFEISLDADELLQEAVDAIIAKAGKEEELTKLLVDFSLDKADNDKSWDISRELKEVGALLLNENNREEIALFADKHIDDFVKVRDFLRKEVDEITKQAVQLGEEVKGIISANGMDPKSFSRGTFIRHIENIVTDSPKALERKYIAYEDIQITKAAKDRDLIEGFIPLFLEQLAEVYQIYAKRAFYKAFLKNITPLSLLNAIGQEMDKIQEEKNILSISQFNAIIHNEIQNQPAPFIYERLGEKYRHFFIDEFQDTSEMQWQNLIPLIDNALSGQDDFGVKGSLMIVGDPKQSIYRWRGGKAEQFIALSKEDNPFSNPSKETVVLGKNYRSYAEVIQFNNALFKDIAQQFQHDDYKDLYENNSYQEINSKEGGYVKLQFLDKLKEETEEESLSKGEQYAEATLGIIKDCVAQGFNYSDVVILTRKRDHGVLLANYLTEHEVPILSSDSLLINNATEVRLIINVLRYLKNEYDIESKVLLLYYVANKMATSEEKHDFIAEGLTYREEKEFEEWLGQKGIKLSFSTCRRKSLYEAVEDIVRAFMPDKSTISYVLYFLDLVLERTIKYQFGISDFLDYWTTNYKKFSIPTPEGKDAVQIMTIHKSKGLEFPVVIFPFAEENYSAPSRDKLWVDIEDDKLQAFPKALVDSKKEVVEYGQLAEELYSAKEQENLLDAINVLYVALTRAEEQLYVLSYNNVSKNGEFANNLSKYFFEFLVRQQKYDSQTLVYEFGDPRKVSPTIEFVKESGNEEISAVKHIFDFDRIKIAQREALMWDSSLGEAIEYGNIVHRIMSFILSKEDKEDALNRALEEGLIKESQKAEIEQKIAEIIEHTDLQDFFDGMGEVFNERMIIGAGHRNSIPDRVVFKGKVAYLLDYKTGKEEDSYKKQVEEYAQVLERMGYQVVKKVILYTGRDGLNMIHL